MNLKRIFGAFFTLLGIVWLIYAFTFFITASGTNHDVKVLIVCGILSIVFSTSGITLIGTASRERY